MTNVEILNLMDGMFRALDARVPNMDVALVGTGSGKGRVRKPWLIEKVKTGYLQRQSIAVARVERRDR